MLTTSPRRSLLALLAALIAAALVWVVAVPALGVTLEARTGATAQPVGLVAVLITTAVAGLAGWGVSALLARLTRRARGIWLLVSCLVAVLSLAGPLTGGTSPAAVVVLALLHVVVAAVLVPGLAPRPRPSAGAVS